MDRDMRLRKVCPQCNTVVYVKRSCCECGHVFTLKRKVQVSADKSMGKAVKRRRALETVEDTLPRQAPNRTCMASMRASETHKQTLRRKEQDRICTASMIINPRRACAARVTVVVLCVCMCVCVCAHSYLPPHTLESQKRDTSGFCAIQGSF